MELAKGKVGEIIQYCIYEIATGKWPPGEKLPSVRKAEKLWGVNRLTVLAAYRELEKTGLAISKDRSGYYVAKTDNEQLVDENLANLYKRIKKLIKANSDADLSYVFRYFNALAISDAEAHPSYAFLECTNHQAEDHANEIYQRLNVFVLPVCLIPNNEAEERIPNTVKTLMTTGFHIAEVQKIGRKMAKEVVNVPIEIDPGPIRKLESEFDRITVVEQESNMSSRISEDIKDLVDPALKVEEKLVNNTDQDISRLLSQAKNRIILLSPRVWGNTSAEIKRDKRVRLIRFRISDSSWNAVSSALRIPLHGSRIGVPKAKTQK